MTTKTETKTQAETPLCACGCQAHVQRPQAKFVRGHDSRLVRQYRERVEAGELTKAAAMKEVGKVSPTLAKKLGRFLDNRAARAKAAKAAEKAAAPKATARKAPARSKAPGKPPEDEPGPGDPVREEAAGAAQEE